MGIFIKMQSERKTLYAKLIIVKTGPNKSHKFFDLRVRKEIGNEAKCHNTSILLFS